MTAACVNLEDFSDASREELEKLEHIGDAFDESGGPCDEYFTQTVAIEGVLRFMFRLSAKAARKTESMEDTVRIWENMRASCDATVSLLKEMKEKHPMCGGSKLYDAALDLRNAASRRIELHL